MYSDNHVGPSTARVGEAGGQCGIGEALGPALGSHPDTSPGTSGQKSLP